MKHRGYRLGGLLRLGSLGGRVCDVLLCRIQCSQQLIIFGMAVLPQPGFHFLPGCFARAAMMEVYRSPKLIADGEKYLHPH